MVRTRGGRKSGGSTQEPQEETSISGSAMTARKRGEKSSSSLDDPQPGPSSARDVSRSPLRSEPLPSKKMFTPEEAGQLIFILDEESDDGLESDLDSGESIIGSDEEEEEAANADQGGGEPPVIEVGATLRFPEETATESPPSTRTTTPRPRPRTPRPIPETPVYSWSQERPLTEHIQFNLNPGLTNPPEGKEPINYFNLIFNHELKEKIVMETNHYAEEKKAAATAPHARIKKWKTLTVEEFTVWLGVLFHMGNIAVARLSDYWSTDILFNFPFFRSVISRDRFLVILSSLHFASNPPPDQPNNDRLYKLRPLLDHFHSTMENIVTPTQRLCIDESMILWRGRLVFRVYLKGKRHKYGVKLYMLTEPSGLVLRFIVYAGSGDQEVGGQGHVDLVVRKLMEGKLDLGHSLFMDNYYNSVRLAHELLERRTYMTGTLRKGRKYNPPEVSQAKLKPFESTFLFSDKGICVVKWKDRREVMMISSEYGPELVDVTNRRGQPVSKPEMVTEYNKSMGGIDHMDQLLAYYPIERKCLKWYRKVGIHIFHLILNNSYILFLKDNPTSKLTLYDFRIAIVKSLTVSASQSKPTTSPAPTPRISSMQLHVPSQMETNDKNRRPTRRCVVCYKAGKRKETSFFCPKCPGKPFMCERTCFRTFHSISS